MSLGGENRNCKFVEVGIQGLLVLAVALFECDDKHVLEFFLALRGYLDSPEKAKTVGKIFLHIVPSVDAARVEYALQYSLNASFETRWWSKSSSLLL